MLSSSLILLLTGAEPWDREGARCDAGSQGRKKSCFPGTLCRHGNFQWILFLQLCRGTAAVWNVPLAPELQAGVWSRDGTVLPLPAPVSWWDGRARDPPQGHLCLLYFGTQKTEFPEGLSQQRQVTGKLPSRWEGWRRVGCLLLRQGDLLYQRSCPGSDLL